MSGDAQRAIFNKGFMYIVGLKDVKNCLSALNLCTSGGKGLGKRIVSAISKRPAVIRKQ
ncbi:hypothetical protein ACCUM_0914 [Candidatus Accumulibacter phosphatis]|uniref:Uncharacterized protein n=1 Tax=Candidatus Accumulibacter phosphatis TaxID=327160 RepID=A0A5S4EGU7_9PROT|nr:hypothetical protein ACCUM_0914 [Candidatus Accumulibacter phosphatis]